MATNPFGDRPVPEVSSRLQEYIDNLRNRYEQIQTGVMPAYPAPSAVAAETPEEEAGNIEKLLSSLGTMQENLHRNLVDLPVNLAASGPLQKEAAQWMQQSPDSWYRDESIPTVPGAEPKPPVSASELAKDAYVGRPEPGESAGTQHAKAVARGVVGRVIDMSADPVNLGLMLGGGALAKVPGLGTAVNLGFGAAMAKATYDASGEAYDLYRKEGWSPAVSEKAAEAGVDAGLLALPIVSGARALRRARGQGRPGDAGEPPSGDAGTPPPSGRMTPEQLRRLASASREEINTLHEQVQAELQGATGARAVELRAIEAQLQALRDIDTRMAAAEVAGDAQGVAELARARVALAEQLVESTRPAQREPTPAEAEGLPPEAQAASDEQMRVLLEQLRSHRNSMEEFGTGSEMDLARVDAVIASIEGQLRQPGRSHAHEKPVKPPTEGEVPADEFTMDEYGEMVWNPEAGGRRPYEKPGVAWEETVPEGVDPIDFELQRQAAAGLAPEAEGGIVGPLRGTRVTGEPVPPAEAGVAPTEAAAGRTEAARPGTEDLTARGEAVAAGEAPPEVVPGTDIVRGETPTAPPGGPVTTPVVPGTTPAPGTAGTTTAGRPAPRPAPPAEAPPAPGPTGAPIEAAPPAAAPGAPTPPVALLPPAIPPISPAVPPEAPPEAEAPPEPAAPPEPPEAAAPDPGPGRLGKLIGPPVRGDVSRAKGGGWRMRTYDRAGQMVDEVPTRTKSDAQAALRDRREQLKKNKAALRKVRLDEQELEVVSSAPGTWDWPTEDSVEIAKGWYDGGKKGDVPALYRTLMNARQMGVDIHEGWQEIFPDLKEAEDVGGRKRLPVTPATPPTREERAADDAAERAEKLKSLPDAAFAASYEEDPRGDGIKKLTESSEAIADSITETVHTNIKGKSDEEGNWLWDQSPLQRAALAWTSDIHQKMLEGKSPWRAVMLAQGGGPHTNRFRAAVQPMFAFPLLDDYLPEYAAEENRRRVEKPELAPFDLRAPGAAPAPAGPATAPVAKKPEPLPQRTRWVGRGIHGNAKVVFPDRNHADLYKLAGKNWKSDDAKRLAKWLNVPTTGDDGIMAIARNYRGDVSKGVRALPKDEAEPEFVAPAARLEGLRTAIEQIREDTQPGETLEEAGGFKVGDKVQIPAPFGRKQDGTVKRIFKVDGKTRAEVHVPKRTKDYPEGFDQNVDIEKITKPPAGGKYGEYLPRAVERGWEVTQRTRSGVKGRTHVYAITRQGPDGPQTTGLTFDTEAQTWQTTGTGKDYKSIDAALDAAERFLKDEAKRRRGEAQKPKKKPPVAVHDPNQIRNQEDRPLEERAVDQAMRRMTGHQERIDKLVNEGATDAQLKDALSYAFGGGGGASLAGTFVEYIGKANPTVWTDGRGKGKPKISGKKLLAMVREMYGIGQPGELREAGEFKLGDEVIYGPSERHGTITGFPDAEHADVVRTVTNYKGQKRKDKSRHALGDLRLAQPRAEAAPAKPAAGEIRYASGMSRPKDFLAAMKRGQAVGVDIGQLSDKGLEQLARGIAETQAPVFIDSGAFSLFKQNLKRQKLEGDEAIVKALDFGKILQRYNELHEALGRMEDPAGESPVVLVMPDVVGDQEGTLAALRAHADEISELMEDERATVVFPVQTGAKSLREFAKDIEKFLDNEVGYSLGDKGVVVGVPANAKAAPPEQIRELAEWLSTDLATGVARLHFLGAASDARLEPLLKAANEGAAKLEWSADANKLRSLLKPGVTRPEAMGGVVGEEGPVEPEPDIQPDLSPNQAASGPFLEVVESYIEGLKGGDSGDAWLLPRLGPKDARYDATHGTKLGERGFVPDRVDNPGAKGVPGAPKFVDDWGNAMDAVRAALQTAGWRKEGTGKNERWHKGGWHLYMSSQGENPPIVQFAPDEGRPEGPKEVRGIGDIALSEQQDAALEKWIKARKKEGGSQDEKEVREATRQHFNINRKLRQAESNKSTVYGFKPSPSMTKAAIKRERAFARAELQNAKVLHNVSLDRLSAAAQGQAIVRLIQIAEDRIPVREKKKAPELLGEVARTIKALEQHTQASTINLDTLEARTLDYAKGAVVSEEAVLGDLQARAERALARNDSGKDLKRDFADGVAGVGEKGTKDALTKGPTHPAFKRILAYNVKKQQQLRGLEEAIVEDGASQGLFLDAEVQAELDVLGTAMEQELAELPDTENPPLPWGLTDPATGAEVTARDALAAIQSKQGRLYARIVHQYQDNSAGEAADDAVPFDVPETDGEDIPPFESPDQKPPRSVLSMPLGKKAVRQAQKRLDFGPPPTVDRPKVTSHTPTREREPSARPEPGGVPGVAGRPPAGVAQGERPGGDAGRRGGGLARPGEMGGTAQRQARPSKGIFSVITVRSEYTERAPAHLELVPQKHRSHLDPHQQVGVGKAIYAMSTEQRGFYLADGTGVGKTREILAVASHFLDQGKKVLVIVPANVINVAKSGPRKGQITGSFQDDSQAMGVPISHIKIKRKDEEGPALKKGVVSIGTYEFIDKQQVDSDTVLILDEAHYVKNPTSVRGALGQAKLDKAHAVLLSTATPGDQAHHLMYMKRMGFLEGKDEKEQLRSLGMIATEGTRTDKKTKKKHKVVIWKSRSRELMRKRLGALMERLTASGRMIKREIDFSGVTVQFTDLKVPEEVQVELDKIENAWEGDDDFNRTQRLMHQRRQLEPGKLPYLKRRIKEELAQGRKVIVFAQRVSRSDAIKKTKVWIGGEQVTLEELITSSEGTTKLLGEWLEEEGIPIARIHGGVKGNKFDQMEAFNKGPAKVVIATVEAGGTGISLDDRVGDAPRTMIFLTAPLESNAFVQAAGRSHRLPTKSLSKIEVLVADHPVDNWNKDIIATKIRLQGALVSGGVKKLDPRIAQQIDEFGEPIVPDDPTRSGESKKDDDALLPREVALARLRDLSTYQGRFSNPKRVVSDKQYRFLRKEIESMGGSLDKYGDWIMETKEWRLPGYKPLTGRLVKPKGKDRRDPEFVAGEMFFDEQGDISPLMDPEYERYQTVQTKAAGVPAVVIRSEGEHVLLETLRGDRFEMDSADVSPLDIKNMDPDTRTYVLSDTRGFFDLTGPTKPPGEIQSRIDLIDKQLRLMRTGQINDTGQPELQTARDQLVQRQYPVTPVGAPRSLVFHGTRRAGFERFDPQAFDPDALYGPGLYVTDNPRVAGTYAASWDFQITPGGGIYPLRVEIPDNRVLDMDAREIPEKLLSRARRDGYIGDNERPGSMEEFYNALVGRRGSTVEANDWLRARGYEALTYVGGVRMAGPDDPEHRAWVLLDPGLAKGAYTFDERGARKPKPRLIRGVNTLIQELPKYDHWRDWTKRHKDTLDRLFGEDAATFQQILGATSAGTSVAGNVTLALKAYFQLRQGKPFIGYMKGVVGNLERIREQDSVGGPKIDPYTKAISGDMSQVWVDRHIARYLFGKKNLKDGITPSAAQRERAEAALRQAAEELGWENSEVSSATWAAGQIAGGVPEEEILDYPTVLERHAQAIRRFIDYFGTEARRSGRSYQILGHPPEGEVDSVLRERGDEGGHAASTGDQLEAVAAVDEISRPLAMPAVLGSGTALRGDDRPDWGYLGSVLAANFAQNWRVRWNGHTVAALEDLGALAQMARSTALEQAHILLVKDGRIVHSIQSGAGMPGTVSPLPMGMKAAGVVEAMKRSGIEVIDDAAGTRVPNAGDGWYVVHNHPGGDARPSLGDYLATSQLAAQIPGFRGHVIVNHGIYNKITPDDLKRIWQAQAKGPQELRDEMDKILSERKSTLLTQQIPPDPLLAQGIDPGVYWRSEAWRVKSEDDFIRMFTANLVRDAERRPGWPIMTFLDSKHRIRGVAWIHPSTFWDPTEFRDWVEARKNEMGALWVYGAVAGSTMRAGSATALHPIVSEYVQEQLLDEVIDPLLVAASQGPASPNAGRAGDAQFQDNNDDDPEPLPGGGDDGDDGRRPPWGNGPGPGEEGWNRRTAYSETSLRIEPRGWGPKRLLDAMITGIARWLRGLKNWMGWSRSMSEFPGIGPFLRGIWNRIRGWFTPGAMEYERRGRARDIPTEGGVPTERPTVRPIPPRPTPTEAARVAAGLVEGATTPVGRGRPPDIPINLNRIRNENDLREVMAQIMALLGEQFAAARGPRQSHAEVKRMALEHGWTIQEFNRVIRTEGTVNAERIIAGRMLRQEAGVDFTQKLQVVRDLARELGRVGEDPVRRAELEAALMEARREMNASLSKFTGIMYGTVAAGSEAGRALAAHRMWVESLTPEERFLRRLMRGRTPPEAELTELAEALRRRDMEAVAKITRKIHKPGAMRMAIEYFINSILSGPATLGANVMGNWVHEALLRTPERGIAGGLEKAGVRQWLERVFHGEATPTERVPGEAMEAARALAKYKFGFISALKEAYAATWSERHGFSIKGEYRPPAIPGLLGKIVRTPSRWMEALDVGARYAARAGERAAQVWRKAVLEGQRHGWDEQRIRRRQQEVGEQLDRWIEMDEMRRIDPNDPAVDYTYLARHRDLGKIKKAMDHAADVSVFRDEVTMFSKYIKLLRGRYPWLTFNVPFINTPERILVQAVRRTPVGLAKTIDNIRTGKLKGGEASDRLAQGIMGSVITAGIYMLAKDGQITGGGPADPRERRNWLATGKQPYAFKVGNRWVSLARIEPIATTLGFAADLAEAQDEKIAGDVWDKLHYSVVNNIANKTYLEGLVSAAEAVGDPDRYGARLYKRMVGALVPNVLNRAAIAIDPVVRQRDSIEDTLLARVPWFSERVPARLTGTGEPITRGEGAFSRFASPFRYSEEAGPEKNLERLFLETGYNPSAPPRNMRLPGTFGRRVDLTHPERETYAAYTQRATEFARGLAKDGDWSALDVYAKQEVLRRIYRYAHDAGRRAVYASVLARIARGEAALKEPS